MENSEKIEKNFWRTKLGIFILSILILTAAGGFFLGNKIVKKISEIKKMKCGSKFRWKIIFRKMKKLQVM